MEKEQFNPSDEQYKKVEDLPAEHQEKFMDVEEGGFVRKEALIELQEANIFAKISIILKEYKIGMDVLHEQALEMNNEKKKEFILNVMSQNPWKEEFDLPDGFDISGHHYLDRESAINLIKDKISDEDRIQEVKFINDKKVAVYFSNRLDRDESIAEKELPKMNIDKDFARKIIQINPNVIYYLPDEYKFDQEILLEVAKSKEGVEVIEKIKAGASRNYGLSSSNFLEKDILLEATKNGLYYRDVLDLIEQRMYNNLDKSGLYEYEENKKIILFAIRNSNHKVFLYDKLLPDEFKGDKEIIGEIVKVDAEIYKYIPEKIKYDTDILLLLFKNHGLSALDIVPPDVAQRIESLLLK